MKIIRLEVENFRKIRMVDLHIESNVVEISAKNGEGKTSLLHAPWVLLKGISQKDSVMPTLQNPIHNGTEQATIRGTFKDKDVGLIVTRTFKVSDRDPKGWTSKLEVTNLEGMISKTSPQQQLDAIIGQHQLDPIEFVNLKPVEQLKAFRAFIPDVDFDLLEEQNDIDFAKRTEVGRDVKRLEGAAASITVPVGTPDAEVDVNALATALQKAGTKNAELEARKAKRAEVGKEVESLIANATDNRARIVELEKQIASFKQLADDADKEAAVLNDKLSKAPPLPEPIPTADITAKIQSANTINASVRLKVTKQKHVDDAKAAQEQYDALTKAMADRTASMAKAVLDAKLPLPNIGFGKNVLLLNGLPFQEASTAEQIRTAVALSMSLHPELRLMWIRDASLLDDDSLAIIYGLATEYDCTVLLETVRPQSGSAIVLVDGHEECKTAINDTSDVQANASTPVIAVTDKYDRQGRNKSQIAEAVEPMPIIDDDDIL